jgi:HSP20 family protein
MAGALARWDPFAEFGPLRSGFDRMFGDWFDGRGHIRTPEIDVVRDDGNLVVLADMPGIKPEEVKIEIEDDVLTVTGEHLESKDETEASYMRRERRYASFCRSLVLPIGVDAKEIKAKTHDGIVEVTIPLPKGRKKETITITPSAG